MEGLSPRNRRYWESGDTPGSRLVRPAPAPARLRDLFAHGRRHGPKCCAPKVTVDRSHTRQSNGARPAESLPPCGPPHVPRTFRGWRGMLRPAFGATRAARKGEIDGCRTSVLVPTVHGDARVSRAGLALVRRAADRHCNPALRVDAGGASLGVEDRAGQAAGTSRGCRRRSARRVARGAPGATTPANATGAGQPLPRRKADTLRRRGLSWRRVALACGYSEAYSGHSARKSVRLYRERLADGSTLHRARKAYQLRERGEAWERVAGAVGYASDRSARAMARRYAARARLPWPVPILEDEGAGT